MNIQPIFIIPARGGSKRVPRKNVRNFCGKPMIAWAIEKAISSNVASKVYVSTDDPAIASVAVSFGATVPFLRDKSLADDITPTIPVIVDFISRLKGTGESFTHVCCLYPTTPLLTSLMISESFNKHLGFTPTFSGFTFSACAYPHPIQRAFYIDESGLSVMYTPQHYSARTQDLSESFYDAGQFYWGSTDAWLSAEKMIHKSNPFIIPSSSVQDIDTQEDWNIAESKFKLLF